jgi:uncharacterized protein YcbX
MQVAALYRHPIKSHGREALQQVTLEAGQTMPWDRTWAVTHEVSKFDHANPQWASCHNFLIGARTPGVLGIWASLNEDKRDVTLTHQDLPDITFCPDNRDDVARFLSWITPLCPENRSAPTDVVSVPGRGMTDSAFPSLSIMNIASHDAVQDALGTQIELERWRGNIWIDGAGAWAEMGWIDRDIRIGDAVLQLRENIKRCPVTNTNPQTGKRDTDTLECLNTSFGHQFFGVYAVVTRSGDIRLGDKVELT